MIDSVRDLAAAASELVTSLGGPPLGRDDVAAMVGEGAGVLVRRALEAAHLPPDTPGALARFLAIYDRRLLDTTVAYDGVADMLLTASRRATMSVLTNKPRDPSLRILDALGLRSYFVEVMGGDNAFGRKPEAGGLRALAGDAEYVMLVGDSPVDAATAAGAGCDFVWARYGFGAARFDKPPATAYAIERPGDLAAVLDRVLAIRSG